MIGARAFSYPRVFFGVFNKPTDIFYQKNIKNVLKLFTNI